MRLKARSRHIAPKTNPPSTTALAVEGSGTAKYTTSSVPLTDPVAAGTLKGGIRAGVKPTVIAPVTGRLKVPVPSNGANRAGFVSIALAARLDPDTSKVFAVPSPGTVMEADAVGLAVTRTVVSEGLKTLRALEKSRVTFCGGFPGPDATVAIPAKLVTNRNSIPANGSAPLYWSKPVNVMEKGRVSVKLAVPPGTVSARTIDAAILTKQKAIAESRATFRKPIKRRSSEGKLHVWPALIGTIQLSASRS